MEEKVWLLIEKHTDDKNLRSEKDNIEPGWDWSKAELKDWNLSGLNLSSNENRANFSGAYVEGAYFIDAQVEGADFSGAQVEGADFYRAQAEGANFSSAQVEGANFSGAQVEGADFYRAQAEGANFSSAQVEGADFESADLTNVNLSYSFLEKTRFDEDTQLTGVRFLNADLKHSYLRRAYSHIDEIVIEEAEGKFENAIEVYLSLKNYFRDEGMYEVSGRYYYREMLMKRKTAWKMINSFKWDKEKKFKSLKECCGNVIGWFVSKMMDLLTGYGEKPVRVVGWWIGLISMFGAIYHLFKGIMNHPYAFAYKPSLLESMYFSVVSFTTLGFGDFRPKPGIFQVVASAEAFLGALFIALFIFVFTRKMIR